jgi:hypothetical protein
MIGGFTIQADNSFLLFMDKGAVAIWRDGAPIKVIAQVASECG